jgi:DNA repair protein RadC
VITRAGGLAGLLAADYQALTAVKGLGPAKRAELMAVLELARRATAQQLREREVLSSPEAVKHYLQLHLAARPHEVFAVLFWTEPLAGSGRNVRGT